MEANIDDIEVGDTLADALGMLPGLVEDENAAALTLQNLHAEASQANFPAPFPAPNFRFTNFDEEMINAGYDSEGNHIFYDPDALDEDPEEYEEQAISEEAHAPPPPAALSSRATAVGTTTTAGEPATPSAARARAPLPAGGEGRQQRRPQGRRR